MYVSLEYIYYKCDTILKHNHCHTHHAFWIKKQFKDEFSHPVSYSSASPI